VSKLIIPAVAALVAFAVISATTSETEDEKPKELEGLPDDLLERIQTAIASGDPERIRAVAAEAAAAGATGASEWLTKLASEYEADQARGKALQSVWSEGSGVDGWAAPALSALSDAQLDDLYEVLVAANPVGSEGAYLDLMAQLENAGLGEQARWLELGQLGALPGGALVQGVIVAAIASGDHNQITAAADAAESAGAGELADYLRQLAESAHHDERRLEDAEQAWIEQPTPPTGLPAPPFRAMTGGLLEQAANMALSQDTGDAPDLVRFYDQLSLSMAQNMLPAHAAWTRWIGTQRGVYS
jgi:uncharacterized protein YidB (DUF937 family)